MLNFGFVIRTDTSFDVSCVTIGVAVMSHVEMEWSHSIENKFTCRDASYSHRMLHITNLIILTN